MSKYELLPTQLIVEGIAEPADFFEPDPLTIEQILSTHTPLYWDKLINGKLTRDEIRKTGFPYSEELISREITIAGGTLKCAQFALEEGFAMNIAGGTHHAFTDRGEGFCLLNDIAVAANDLLNNYDLKRILIVDLDVHQGNGTAEIFAGDDRVFTLSMHGAKNYPLKKEKSSLDIPLADGTQDVEYLKLLHDNLSKVLSDFQPEFIFYQSGVDILASDKLGRLNVSMGGCKLRDEMVFEAASHTGIPIVACMGGGYSPKISTIVDAHTTTFEVARDVFS